jgi:hypothetical protein
MPLLLALAAAALGLLSLPAASEASKRRVPHGFFGVMWDRAAAGADLSTQDRQWALMARSGVESVRTEIKWRRVQPQPGPPDFSKTDQLVGLSARHGIQLLPVVLGTPYWAAEDGSDLASRPRDPDTYAALLTALVARYGPKGSFWNEHPELPRRPVRTWQIWNEPHFVFFWRSFDEPWAISYVKLLRASHRAIKSADPGAKIVAAAMTNASWQYVDELYRAGGSRYFDVLAMNFFTHRPALVMSAVATVRRRARRHGDTRVPIWLTEVTWPASRGKIEDPGGQARPTTSRGAATRLSDLFQRAATRRRGVGLERVFWYTWASSYSENEVFDYSGLIRFDGQAFSATPALAAFAQAARRFEGCRKTSRGNCRRR